MKPPSDAAESIPVPAEQEREERFMDYVIEYVSRALAVIAGILIGLAAAGMIWAVLGGGC